MIKKISCVCLLVMCFAGISSSENLLLNPTFEFHAFNNHRHGEKVSFESHNTAFWNTDSWGDIKVERESHLSDEIRPDFSTGNIVSIKPGKRFYQFFTLPEARLAHNETISLLAYGYQESAEALVASVKLLKLDSEDGTWKPSDFGMKDERSFPKHSRGELVVAEQRNASSSEVGKVVLSIEDFEIKGQFGTENKSSSNDNNTIAIMVEFNNSSDSDVFVYSPTLVKSEKAYRSLKSIREAEPYYRYLPRTIQKLWKGEPLHIIVTGSSIDIGDSNPPMYTYDEDPESETFKQPLYDGYDKFDSDLVGRPDLAEYFTRQRSFYTYSARLKLELMRKYDLAPDKICLNMMAAGGSCIGEAHSALKDTCSLNISTGTQKSWKELYPELFKRSGGVGPDLVIFGSGANEKTDTPDEVAVFEGMIRWLQKHYPNVEFIFSQFQNKGGYTGSPGDMQALALKYQIPFIDYGKLGDDLTRWCNRYALVPADGHPQAAVHYIWFKQLEKAFECWDPVLPGISQKYLPERLHGNTYGWEGEMNTYDHDSSRVNENSFILDDTVINCWTSAGEFFVDGVKRGKYGYAKEQRNRLNSSFRIGNLKLGDRHILEVAGDEPRINCVDSKICSGRKIIGVENKRFGLDSAAIEQYESKYGHPYGEYSYTILPDQTVTVDVVCTDISVAYLDTLDGGMLEVVVDGEKRLTQKTNVPFTFANSEKEYIENRKGVLGLGFGWHHIELTAKNAPVKLLSVFTYDSRSNKDAERQMVGAAVAGEKIIFSQPFKTRPFVMCNGDLRVKVNDATENGVVFSGSGEGTYLIFGE